MGIEMKIATFVLSLLSVSGQTTDGTSPDERRKKWKTTEPATTTTLTTTDPATTTTTTTTTSTESTTTTAEPATTRVHTLPPNVELGGDKDTKQNWDPVLFNQDKEKDQVIIDSDDPDIVHTGHQFGSMLNLETKGPILDEVKAPDQGKGGKKKGKGKKKDADDSESEPDSSDDDDDDHQKDEEPKKKKKQKESKKNKGNKKK